MIFTIYGDDRRDWPFTRDEEGRALEGVRWSVSRLRVAPARIFDNAKDMVHHIARSEVRAGPAPIYVLFVPEPHEIPRAYAYVAEILRRDFSRQDLAFTVQLHRAHLPEAAIQFVPVLDALRRLRGSKLAGFTY